MSNNNFNINIIGCLISPVNRRTFKQIVEKHKGDYACKKLSSWEHFISILLGQFTNSSSLREIENLIRYNKDNQYHLGIKKDICRSTLSYANNHRSYEIYRDLFLNLVSNLKVNEIKETKDIIRIIDSTPIQIKENWCEKTIRIKGEKVHTIYDPNSKIPTYFSITGAKTSDITEGKKIINIDKGCIYIFDRGYIDYTWWDEIDNKGAYFVTRNYKHCNYTIEKRLYNVRGENNNDNNSNDNKNENNSNNDKESNRNNEGNENNKNNNNSNKKNDNENKENNNKDKNNSNDLNNLKEGDIIEDNIISFNTKITKRHTSTNIANSKDRKYKKLLRQVVIKRDRKTHKTDLIVYTNILDKTAEEIGELYKRRWKIELFFKWIKQNLKIKKFLGKSKNAINIQICISMIAFVLLRIAEMAQKIGKKLSIKAIITIVKCGIFTRIREHNPYKYKQQKNISQLQFSFMYDKTG